VSDRRKLPPREVAERLLAAAAVPTEPIEGLPPWPEQLPIERRVCEDLLLGALGDLPLGQFDRLAINALAGAGWPTVAVLASLFGRIAAHSAEAATVVTPADLEALGYTGPICLAEHPDRPYSYLCTQPAGHAVMPGSDHAAGAGERIVATWPVRPTAVESTSDGDS
jgi:hypothetical protein